MQRNLLGVLLARAGRHVLPHQLTEALWNGSPPPSAGSTLQVHVHRLRRALGDSRRIAHGPSGYRIAITADEFDALRFAELTERARRERAEGRHETATESLDRALALWRGEPYSGIAPSHLVAAEADRMTELLVGTRQEWFEAHLDLGRHQQTVGALAELVKEHPYHERLGALLMLALHRAGRQADALEVYRTRRETLVSDLGIEPGELLRRMHEAVLRGDERLSDVATATLDGTWAPVEAQINGGGRAAVPRELPMAPHGFFGRDADLRRLDQLLDSGSAPGAAPLAVLTGMGGIGKTALAVRWAHRVAERFPDGQLFIDLRGHSQGTALRPIDALAALLGSLGVAADQIPLEVDRAAAKFRTLIGDRRVLIVLDNAARADQVHPLLPSGAGCLVLVTSRHRLSNLVARHGASRIALEPLAAEDSRELVKWLINRHDGSTRAREATAVAELCAGLPLALRIAAANLADGAGEDPAAYLARLTEGDRLASLQLDDSPDAAIRAVFESSYRSIPADAKRLFRLLGLAPGPDFSAEAAAELAGTSVEETESVLDRLVAAHLVDRHRPERYRLHDLLRLYAEERTGAEEAPQERADATGRLLDWYLHRADACRTALYPAMAGLPLPEPKNPHFEPTPEAAIEWLTAERGNLVAAVEHAAEHGRHSIAWLLSDVLRGYAWWNMPGSESVRIGQAAVAASKTARDLLGQAAAELSLATVLMRSNRSSEAVEHGERAAKCAGETGWLAGQAAATHVLTGACYNLGRLREGIVHAQEALRTNRELGRTRAQCNNLDMLGHFHCDLGELDTAVECYWAEHAVAAEVDSESFQAIALVNLANTERLQGRLDLADQHLEKVFEMVGANRSIGDFSPHYRTAARVHLAAGRLDEALAAAESAVGELQEFPTPQIEADALLSLAAVRDARGEHREAITHCDRALKLAGPNALFQWIDAVLGRATALYRLGELGPARDGAALALQTAHDSRFRIFEGDALNLIARIDLGLNRLGDAEKAADQALRVNRETGFRLSEAESLRVSGDVRDAAGDPVGAKRYRDQAQALYDEMGAVSPWN